MVPMPTGPGSEESGAGLFASTLTATATPVPKPTPTPTETLPPFEVRPTPTPTQTLRPGIAPTPTPTMVPGETPRPIPTTPTPRAYPRPSGIPVWRFAETHSSVSNVEVQVGRAVIREGLHGVLFYVVTAPPELEGRELLPRDVQVVGDTGTSYPVIESKPLVTVGRLTLGALSFSLQDRPQPGDLAVEIKGFIAPSPGGYGGQVVEDTWRLDPALERTDAGYPEGEISDLRAAGCAVVGDAGVAFSDSQRCEPFELSPPTPTPVPTPTATPPGYSQPGATPTPTRSQPWPPVTPTPTSTPYPLLAPTPTPAPKPTPTAVPTATPYPPGFPKPTATPTPARVPSSTYSLTFKVYDAQSSPEVPYYCLNVLVGTDGTVSVIRFAPVEDPDVGCPPPR